MCWIKEVVKSLPLPPFLSLSPSLRMKKGFGLMRKVHAKSTLPDSIFSPQHKDGPSPHAPAREERRGDRFKSSATALDSLRMPLPFGTPCYFKNIRGDLIYCSALSSGWQESPQGNTKLGNRSGGGRGRGLAVVIKSLVPFYILLLDEFVKTDPWCFTEDKLRHRPP